MTPIPAPIHSTPGATFSFAAALAAADDFEARTRCMVEGKCCPLSVAAFVTAQLAKQRRVVHAAYHDVMMVFRRAPEWTYLGSAMFRTTAENYHNYVSLTLAGMRSGQDDPGALDEYRGATADFLRTAIRAGVGAQGSEDAPRQFVSLAEVLAVDVVLTTLEAKYARHGYGPTAHVDAAGEAIFAAYHRQPSFALRLRNRIRPKIVTEMTVSTIPSLLTGTIPWARQLVDNTRQAAARATDVACLTALEQALPAETAHRNRATIHARAMALQHTETELAAIAVGERAYAARATAKGEESDGRGDLHRAPLIDVAQLVGYTRVRNGADPLEVYRAAVQHTGPAAKQAVARSIEAALSRRWAECLVDRYAGPDGEVFRRPIGMELDPRYRAMIDTARSRGRMVAVLERLRLRFTQPPIAPSPVAQRAGGPLSWDAEIRSIERYANRLLAADLLRDDIVALRPITLGDLNHVPRRRAADVVLAEGVYVETEGIDPLVDADGELVDWQQLILRHPDAGSVGARRRIGPLESSVMKPAPTVAEAYPPRSASASV